MSEKLSEENRALIQQDLGQSYWEPNDCHVWLAAATEGDVNRLLNAAREQGRQSPDREAVSDVVLFICESVLSEFFEVTDMPPAEWDRLNQKVFDALLALPRSEVGKGDGGRTSQSCLTPKSAIGEGGASVDSGSAQNRRHCFICAGADDDQDFDECGVCGRKGVPLPFGASGMSGLGRAVYLARGEPTPDDVPHILEAIRRGKEGKAHSPIGASPAAGSDRAQEDQNPSPNEEDRLRAALTEAMEAMARAFERLHSLPRTTDTQLADRVVRAKEGLRPFLTLGGEHD